VVEKEKRRVQGLKVGIEFPGKRTRKGDLSRELVAIKDSFARVEAEERKHEREEEKENRSRGGKKAGNQLKEEE